MADEFKFSPEQRAEIKRLAIITAGPGANLPAVAAEAERIAHLYSPSSIALDESMDSIEFQLKKVAEFKQINGTILYVDREIKSRRAVIVLKTKVHERYAPNAQEYVRTGITVDGGDASAFANLASAHRGHRARLNVGMELMGNNSGNKVRVLHDLRIQAVDNEYDPNTPIDFAGMNLDPAKLELASQWAMQGARA